MNFIFFRRRQAVVDPNVDSDISILKEARKETVSQQRKISLRVRAIEAEVRARGASWEPK